MQPTAHPVYHLTLVRHGESVGNAENRLQGHSDFPLSVTGKAQAQALAARWQREGLQFDAAIASPLSRAADTARILVAGLGVPSLELDPLWLERDNGQRAGLTMEEIRARFQDKPFLDPYHSNEGGMESDWALYLRAGQALHSILQRPPARYLVVSHGAILNMALYAILGITPQPSSQGVRFALENTAFSSFRYTPDTHRWRVFVISDRTHWPPKDE